MANFDTTAPAQARGLNGYVSDPLFTVGETINTGNPGTTAYTPLGILDGIGAYSLNATTVRVLVNHEVANNVGYNYTLANGTTLRGSRISYFDIDKTSLQIVGSGLAYNTIRNRAGQQVGVAGAVLDTVNSNGINRFCSGVLIEANKFGAGRGFVDTIYFAGEETTGGTEFALNVATNELWAVPWLGRAAWENVTEVDTGNTNQIALLIGDDRSAAIVNGTATQPVAPILLYVGTKSTATGATFLERNGLVGGKMYAWVADDPTSTTDPIETTPVQFFQTGGSLRGRFVEITIFNAAQAGSAVDGPDTGTSIQDGERGFDAQGYATQGEQDAQYLATQAFRFSRPEDVATNPADGTQVVLASTGNGANPTDDTWGTTYRIDIDFNNIATGDITARVDILYAGDDAGNGAFPNPDSGLRSPDNIEWADDGFIYINEDDAVDTGTAPANTVTFGGASGQEASIWRLDPRAANPAASLVRVAQIDRTALPPTQTDASPTDIGNWETSGIVDVSSQFGVAPGQLLIYDTQAHSLRNGTIISNPGVDTDGSGTVTREDNLVEGGQLAFLRPQADTTAPAQVRGLNGYSVDPVFTVGETLIGTGALNSTTTGKYTPVGILDGIGAYSLNTNTVRVLVNHELADNVGYAYRLENGTSLIGARVSYFDIDKTTLKVVDSGLAYRRVYDRQGNIVTNAQQINEEATANSNGFDRFCSAVLIEAAQFGNGRGLTNRLFFMGEEASTTFGHPQGGSMWTLDLATGDAWALPDFGRGAWENITELDTGTTDRVAFLLSDDSAPAPMYLYVGTKNAAGTNVVQRNGLSGGQMYVWVADDRASTTDIIEKDPTQFRGTGNVVQGQWVPISVRVPASAGQTGFDAQGYRSDANLRAEALRLGGFQFSRPEDVATNPADGTQAVMASTGFGQLFNGVENWGTTYIFDTDFVNIGAGTINASVRIIYDGNDAGGRVGLAGNDFGARSVDNLDWADDGLIYINEDRSTNPATLFGGASGQEASIWRIDPNAANPAGTLTRIAQIDRSALPPTQTDSSATDRGNWETSGILDVSTLFNRRAGELFLFDTQAHSLRNGTIITNPGLDPNGNGATREENLVEGGQLAFLSITKPAANTLPTLASESNQLFNLGAAGTTTNLRFTLTSRNAEFVNEIGVLVVDDAQGRVDGIAPGASGYTQAALRRSQVIFSTLSEGVFPSLESVRHLQIPGGQRLQFFLVQNSTVDNVLAGKGGQVFFATPSGNSSSFDNFNATGSGSTLNLSFEDTQGGTDLDDVQVRVEAVSTGVPSTIGLQGRSEAELIDLRALTGNRTVAAQVFREAEFNNLIGFYRVSNADGTVGSLTPGATGFDRATYTQNALNNRITSLDLLSGSNNATTSFSGTFAGGSLLAPFIVINGTIAQALSGAAQVYFPFLGANADGVDHIRLLGDNTFGFEDLPGGGDADFDDIVVKLTIS